MHALPSKEAILKKLEKAQRLVKRANESKLTGDNLNKFVDKLQLILIELNQEITIAYFNPPEDYYQKISGKNVTKIA